MARQAASQLEARRTLFRLEKTLKEKERALEEINQLRHIVPICALCKSVRDDHDYWHQVEDYFERHQRVAFSHGICPTCMEKMAAEISLAY
jgi:hypothetical protein